MAAKIFIEFIFILLFTYQGINSNTKNLDSPLTIVSSEDTTIISDTNIHIDSLSKQMKIDNDTTIQKTLDTNNTYQKNNSIQDTNQIDSSLHIKTDSNQIIIDSLRHNPLKDSLIEPPSFIDTLKKEPMKPQSPADSLRERLILELRKIADLAYNEQNWKQALDYYKRYINRKGIDNTHDSILYRYLRCYGEIGPSKDPEGQEELKNILPRFDLLSSGTVNLDSLNLIKAKILITINANGSLWSRKNYLKESYNILQKLREQEIFFKRASIELAKWHNELNEYRDFILKLMGFGTGHYARSTAILEEAIEKYPNDCEISYYLAVTYIKSNRIPEALMEFKRLQKLPEKNRQDNHFKQLAIPYLLNLLY